MRRWAGGGYLLLLTVACGPERHTKPQVETAAATASDTLLLALPGGTEVWWTLARTGRDSLGAPCVERAVELRTGHARTLVPLLYTTTPPVARDDTTLEADLSNQCRPAGRYRISVRSGQPQRIDE